MTRSEIDDLIAQTLEDYLEDLPLSKKFTHNIRTAIEARGLCIVPREATEAMKVAGSGIEVGPHDDVSYLLGEEVVDIWTAMIAASETQP